MLKILEYKLFSSQQLVLIIEEMNVEEGTFVHIEGANSLGKTLFLKSLCGQYKNFKGKLLYRKKRLSDNNVLMIGGSLPVVENMSFLDNIQIPLGKINTIQRNRLIEMATILGVVDLLNNEMKYSSRSERMLMYLIRASLISPNILLIDDFDTLFDEQRYEKVCQFIQYCLKSGMMVITTGKFAVDNVPNYLISKGEMKKV
jgi:ABC-type transport system involved in cytochrome c biogenesis ATPase subunit